MGDPVHSKTLGSIPGLYPLDAGGIPYSSRDS